jgi:hypothetical protein
MLVTRVLPFYAIDFEASSLSEKSYPIEVAWGNSQASIKSRLINPKNIPNWVEWDHSSEAIHGIKRDELLKLGISPNVVAKEMVKDLSGKLVLADGGSHDVKWKNRLLAVTKYKEDIITITDYNWYCLEMLNTLKVSAPSVHFLAARDKFEESNPRPHRAAGDVEWIFCFHKFLLESVVSPGA